MFPLGDVGIPIVEECFFVFYCPPDVGGGKNSKKYKSATNVINQEQGSVFTGLFNTEDHGAIELHWLYSELEDQQVAPPTFSLFQCQTLKPID